MEIGDILKIGAAVLPFLYVIIFVVKKLVPQADPYFQTAYVTLTEIDDLLAAIEDKFPDLPHINTVDEVVDEIIKQLEKAGYKDVDREKVKNRVIGSLSKKEGFDIDLEDGFKINYNKKF